MSLLRKAMHYVLQTKGFLVFGKRVGIHGNFTVENPANVTIGEGCEINNDVHIVGRTRVTIGNFVVLSAQSMLLDAGLDLNGFAERDRQPHIDSPIVIEDGVWVGAGAIILPGVTIGRKSVIGAGSVVTKDVPPFTVVVGNPARPIGTTKGRGVLQDQASRESMPSPLRDEERISDIR
jgi:maltose O-acetyltransferase